MVFVAVLAFLAVALSLYVTDRVRRGAAANRRRQVAEERLRAAMRQTEKRLEIEKSKREQAAALTSLVPAIRKHGNRHVP